MHDDLLQRHELPVIVEIHHAAAERGDEEQHDPFGPMDLGACEIQTQVAGSCSASGTIFCNGFDGP